jgi:hypothetical protein
MTRTRLLFALLWPLQALGALAVLPLVAVGAGMAAAGLIGGLMSNKKTKSQQAVNVDKDNYVYGGQESYGKTQRAALGWERQYKSDRNVLGASSGGYEEGYAGQRATRAEQWGAANDLGNHAAELGRIAAGQGPTSAAELQQRAGVSAAAKNAMNVAATARGGNYANAAVSAQDANAQAAQSAVQDAVMTRAQESAAARAQQADVLGRRADLISGIRAGDQSAAQLGAGYDQGRNELALQQLGQNDAYRQMLLEGEFRANENMQEGTMAYEEAKLRAAMAAQGYNVQAAEGRAERSNRIWGGLIGGGGAMLAQGLKKLCPSKAGPTPATARCSSTAKTARRSPRLPPTRRASRPCALTRPRAPRSRLASTRASGCPRWRPRPMRSR